MYFTLEILIDQRVNMIGHYGVRFIFVDLGMLITNTLSAVISLNQSNVDQFQYETGTPRKKCIFKMFEPKSGLESWIGRWGQYSVQIFCSVPPHTLGKPVVFPIFFRAGVLSSHVFSFSEKSTSGFGLFQKNFAQELFFPTFSFQKADSGERTWPEY